MRYRIISTLLLLLMGTIKPLWAESNNYWQCMAHDALKKQWEAKSSYERVAANKAFETCKKESKVPTTCTAVQDSCNYFGKPIVITPGSSEGAIWKCTALDSAAHPWIKMSSNRDAAALSAKSTCVQHSSVPDTCYINLLTCININK